MIKQRIMRSSMLSVDHLVFVVAIVVQSPGVGCHLNRVVVCIAQEWFGLL